MISVSWILGTTSGGFQSLILFLILWIRFLIALMLDQMFAQRSIFVNVIRVLTLMVSDSAYPKSENPRLSRISFIIIACLSSLENLIFIIYAAHVAPVEQYYAGGLFATVLLVIFLRLVLLFHWTLRVHFPELDGSPGGLTLIGRD